MAWLQINYLENTMVKIWIWLQKVWWWLFPPQNTLMTAYKQNHGLAVRALRNTKAAMKE